MRDKVIISTSKYINDQERTVEIIYKADAWSISDEKENYPILHIHKENIIIASHKIWDSVKFAEDDPIEKVVIID